MLLDKIKRFLSKEVLSVQEWEEMGKIVIEIIDTYPEEKKTENNVEWKEFITTLFKYIISRPLDEETATALVPVFQAVEKQGLRD